MTRPLGAAATMVVVLALSVFLGFTTWAYTLAEDVAASRDELRARVVWLETTNDLLDHLGKSDPESIRFVAARGLDLLTELRAHATIRARSSALLSSLKVTFADAQQASPISPALSDAMVSGLHELVLVLRMDEGRLDKRVDERWSEVMMLIIASVVLCLGLVTLLLLFLRGHRMLARNRSRFTLLVRGAREGLWEWDAVQGTAQYSSRWHAILGLSAGDVPSTIEGWLDRIHPADVADVRRVLEAHLAGETTFFERDHRVRHGSGRYRWVRVAGVAAMDSHGQPTAMSGSLADISAMREAREVADEGMFLERVLTGLGGALAVLDIESGTLVHGPGLIPITGQWRTPEAWWEQVRGVLRLPDEQPCAHCDQPMMRGRVMASTRGPQGRRQVFELTFGFHDHGLDAAAQGHTLLVRDITAATKAAEMAALEVKTDECSVIDRVTGLPDRRAFMKKVGDLLADDETRKRHDFAVVCLDLDGLGLVNDTLGSKAGDLLLQTVAKRLKHAMGPLDVLSRIGGDEFGVLMRGIADDEHATSLISGLSATIGDPVDLLGLEVIPTATVGAAIGHSGYKSAEELIRQAEAACRSAVKGGKRAVQIVRGPVEKGTRKTLRMNTDLRRALERNEFELHYQPIVPLKPGMPRGFEALLRWTHPEFGPVSPVDFIPIAEATGAIVPIGFWVLREACYRLMSWQEMYPQVTDQLVMSVNLSMRQLRERDLVEQLRIILAETGVVPEALKLEITESAVMENPEEAEPLLARLKELGVRLWVDDFGTGYSSLSYLQRFPIDGLKIDRSFVSPVDADESSQQIATSIIELGHNLGLEVVAEGIETAAQLAFLQSHDCDLAQGRYFSGALPEAAANALVATWNVPGGATLDTDTQQDRPAALSPRATLK